LGEPLNPGLQNLTLEARNVVLLCSVNQPHWLVDLLVGLHKVNHMVNHLNRLGVTVECDRQTDGRMDINTNNKHFYTANVAYVARPKFKPVVVTEKCQWRLRSSEISVVSTE